MTTEITAICGKSARPTPMPASTVSGRPTSSRRLGHSSWRRSARRSMRIASLNSSSTRAISATRSAPDGSMSRSKAEGRMSPATTPMTARNRAAVTPRFCSGPDSALHTARATSTTSTAITLGRYRTSRRPAGRPSDVGESRRCRRISGRFSDIGPILRPPGVRVRRRVAGLAGEGAEAWGRGWEGGGQRRRAVRPTPARRRASPIATATAVQATGPTMNIAM